MVINAVYHDNDDESIPYISRLQLAYSFCNVAVINITFQVVFIYDIFFGVIHKAYLKLFIMSVKRCGVFLCLFGLDDKFSLPVNMSLKYSGMVPFL